jgi:two-component system cell cycle sensor histidine kinase/response regulator CckA
MCEDIRILIVEDERIVAEHIRQSLVRLSYKIAGIASSGSEAFQMASETGPDLVLMDIVLKGRMDGIETAHRIFNELNIPVIYLSAYTDEKTIRRAKITEPYGYIVKPFDESSLKSSIEIALHRHTVHKKSADPESPEACILRSFSETVIYHDLNDRVIWVNEATGNALGIDAGNLVGKKCRDLWKRQKVSCRSCPVSAVVSVRGIVETEVVSADERVWSVRGYPVYDVKRRIIGIVEVSREITSEKQVQSEKRSINTQLQQKQKMEAIGILTGGVAHDFNNILTAIQGSVEMALFHVTESEPIYRDLKEIQAASARAINLTRQLLLFSRKHPTVFKPLQMNRTIQNLLKMLKRLIGEDIHIETRLDTALWMIRADQAKMEQVLMNLVINARDAMPQGGIIRITTENVNLQSGIEKVMAESSPGDFIRLTLKDTGEGIEPAVLDRIFEPFFTTKGKSKGTGLGLSVVYGIIKHHKGWIDVHSEPGKGSVFNIYLPAIPEATPESKVSRISIETLRGNGEHVLVVEDADDVRGFTISALREYGYRVTAVTNAQDAWSLIQRQDAEYNLLFADVVLPDQSGIELVQTIRKHRKHIETLLTSGYTDSKLQWPVIQRRKYPFLEKPYSLIQLLQAVKEMLETGKAKKQETRTKKQAKDDRGPLTADP